MHRWQPHQYPGTLLEVWSDSTILLNNRIAESKNTEAFAEGEITAITNNGGTKFQDDLTEAVIEPVKPQDITSTYLLNDGMLVQDSLARYLSKPVEIEVGQFAVSDVPLTFPFHSFPKALLVNPLYANKIQGFFGFRATLVLRLQVNAERFQQGRYMLCATPMGGMTAGLKATQWYTTHSSTLVQRSQLPHAEVDLATETGCELRLPFSSAHDFYPLQRTREALEPIWYFVRIHPYVALTSGAGSPTAKYTLWAHFEDVQFIGQCVPVELQSGISGKSFKRKSASEYEAKQKGVGPIESITRSVAKASSYLAPLPIIGSFASQLSWVSDILANTASVFGWSAPINLDSTRRIRFNEFAYATNVNKVDNSMPLSTDANNQVCVLPGLAPTEIDEMNVSAFASKMSYQDIFTWSTSQAENAILAEYDAGIYPTTVQSNIYGTGSTVLAYSYTPAQYLATLFSGYRGSVLMRFKFVKTEFHSGRLSIEFNPNARGITPGAIDDSVAPFVYRDIVDVRSLNEYSFEIPYISETPYLDTETGLRSAFGRIEVRVIDPLVGPATVASTVSIIMEMALGKDAEFFGYRKLLSSAVQEVTLQSGDFHPLGGMTSHKFQVTSSSVAVGERIGSLRLLLKKFVSLSKATVAPNDADPVGTLYTVAPFGTSSVRKIGEEYTREHLNDIYGEMMGMFLYSRGGIRLKATSSDSSRSVVARLVSSDRAYGITNVFNSGIIPSPNIWSPDTIFSNACNFVMEQNNNSAGIEIQVPQYSYCHSRCNPNYICCETAPFANTSDNMTNNYVVQASAFEPLLGDSRTTTAAQLRFYRAAADDADFSFFVSIPPMTRDVLGIVP